MKTQPEASTVYLAYHQPYSLEQHHNLIARCSKYTTSNTHLFQ